MTAQEKIQKYRSAYIHNYNCEPKSVILGYEIIFELSKTMPRLLPGTKLYGMRVIVDNNKPTRVETGDFET